MPYVTDLPYVRTFSNGLSPSVLRLAVSLNGFATAGGDAFDYLELGCANGDTLIALAAAFPNARFVGVDVNAGHVAFARELADRCELSNVCFLQADFEQLERASLPAFDFVCMYGLLSWISPDKRKAAIALAGDKLKDGGILFATYNAMPGWSAVEPLRRLMLDAAEGIEGSAARAHRGLSVARMLDEAGAHYFAQNPAARNMLSATIANGLSYAVHEYFLPDWHPMYFLDLAQEMAACGLHFAAQLPLYCNYRDLVIPAPLAPLFQGVQDRIAFERLKDYALNEFFRRDVFVKGDVSRADDITRGYLDDTLFGTLVSAEQVKRKVKLPNHTLEYAGAMFDTVIAALSEQPRSVSMLAEMPALAPHGEQQLRQAVMHLLLGEQVWPVKQPCPALGAHLPARVRPALAYNREMIAQPLQPGGLVVLSCPATGAGIVMSAVEIVALRALSVEPLARGEWLRLMVAKQPVTLHAEGRRVDDYEEQVRVLEAEVAKFAETRLAKLIQLGIVEAAE